MFTCSLKSLTLSLKKENLDFELILATVALIFFQPYSTLFNLIRPYSTLFDLIRPYLTLFDLIFYQILFAGLLATICY